MIEVVALSDRPEFIPLVAEWNWQEWSDLLAFDSAEAFADDLRARTSRDAIPLTFLALENGVPVATASLLDDDLETRPELHPWLASLYVVPGRRGDGLGKMMVEYVVGAARLLGIGTLYLYTAGHAAFYRQLRWEDVEETMFRGHRITIMKLRLH